MREILVRGKRKDNGEWVEGNLIHRTKFYGYKSEKYFIMIIGEFHCDYYEAYEVKKDTVGQFTGPTDKNSVKIFEGDIIEVQNPKPFKNDFGYVYFDNGTFKVKFNGYENNLEYMNSENFGFDFYVVGNVFDNPELIHSKED